MTKVECLRRMLANLGGQEAITSEDDTVCELLHKIADYVGTSKKTNISSKFTGTINTDKYSGTCGINALKSNANYQIDTNINITALATGNALGKVATITIPEGMRDFQSQYVTAYYSIKSGETTTYAFMNVGLSHVRNEATAEIHILDSISVSANDIISFAGQFKFMA